MAQPQVFISYSRPDDACFGKNTRGWVTALADNLHKLLQQQPGGRAFKVWMDHHLPPEKSLSPGLSEALGQSAALLALLSPGWLDSQWCPGELDHYLARHGGRTDERVFLAEYLRSDRARLPMAVQGLVPVAFWEQATEHAAPMPLGFPSPGDDDRLYWTLLRELAHAIGRCLGRDATQADAPPARKVWIATPTDDLRQAAVELAGTLRQLGLEVIDTEDALMTKRGAEAEAELATALAEADLLLQCFGPHAGRVYADLNESTTALQHRVARQVAQAKGKSLLTWRPPELKLEDLPDPAYRALLTGSLACGLEAFKRQVADELKPRTATAPSAATAAAHSAAAPAGQPSLLNDTRASGLPPLICVSADAIDQQLGQDVLGLLAQLGAEALLAPEPNPDLPADQWRSHYEQALVESDGLLVVYGRSQPLWVQSRLAASRRMIANRRAATRTGLLDASPLHAGELPIRMADLARMDCRAGLTPAPLQTYVQQLRQGMQGQAGGLAGV
ncbi:MAG: hypothetical protein RIQ60_1802 [Pseudomonadota bacterium]|jgi:hypothetical protein